MQTQMGVPVPPSAHEDSSEPEAVVPEVLVEHTIYGVAPPPLQAESLEPAAGGTPLESRARAQSILPTLGAGDVPSLDGDEPVPVVSSSSRGRTRLYPGLLIPGTRLRVDGWLGEGATAVVYRGEHVDLERRLAIKVLRDVPPDEEARARFLHEAKVTAGLRSPFVAEVADFGTLPDGRPYYAMSLVQGRTVAEMIDEGPLLLARVIAMLRMACKAVDAAHKADIIHRDIKPANMVLEGDRGPRRRLVLLDFGIASHNGGNEELRCGTPSYMAPEQILGETLDTRVDIYALGCCAYEMLWGRMYVEGETTQEVLAGHLEPKPFEVPPGPSVPAQMQAIVKRCVAYDPNDRFQSAAELEAAICEAQIALSMRCTSDYLEPPEVEPERRAAIVTALVGRRRRHQVKRTAILVAVALLAVLGLSVWASTRHQAEAEAAARVDEVVAAARASADLGVFVFPLPDSDVATAYSTVLQLEQWSGPGRDEAVTQAQLLRKDLAARLIVQGDAAWEDPMTRGYGRDYYAQALVFQPQSGRARERVGMTSGEIAELRHKAETTEFTEAELDAAEVLADIVNPDAIEQEPEPEADPKPTTRVSRSSKKSREEDDVVAAADAASPGPSSSPEDEDEDDEQAETTTKRNPSAARRMVRRGYRALRRGDRADAQTQFERAVSYDSRNAAAYAGLADTYFEQGRHERALHFAKMAARRDRRNADHHVRLGDSYLRVGQRSHARTAYERAATLGSKVADGRLAKVAG